MSERSIRRLRRQFILTSTCTLTAVMFLIGGLIYFANLSITRKVIRDTINYIVENEGDLNGSQTFHIEDESETGVVRFLDEIFADSLKKYRTSEIQYSSRYFAVLYDENDEISEIKTNQISSLSREEAEDYSEFAKKQFLKFGRRGAYYYQVSETPKGHTIVVYLDSTEAVASTNRVLFVSLILIGFGLIATAVLVVVFSKKAIAPEIENAELQKQFITNASHELKTPLAVIRANTEMQEMLEGESEWTKSTMRQIERMNGLIQNLVMISRADENSNKLIIEQIDVSKAIRETAESFRSLIVQENKSYEISIAENIHLRADESQIRQLASLLLDNAIKYCDDEGTVGVELTAKGRGIQLVISNSYADGDKVDCSKFFERFYREDPSHNTEKGGYGIGLSIAENIVKRYHGTVDASWKKGVISFTCVLKNIIE